MLVKKEQKTSLVVFIVIFVVIFYYMLRVFTMANSIGGNLNLECFTTTLNELYKINTPINITKENFVASVGIALFTIMLVETYRMQNKKNIQDDTYGSAEWCNPKDIQKKKDKDFENNIILTQTELISKNMKKSGMNRHIILLGRPGTGKSRYFFKPNLLSSNSGSIIVTDPKGELLRDCGYSLKQKGYDIKVLNLDEKSNSNNYNPLLYIKELPTFDEVIENDDIYHPIQEDDVMTLINTLMANTKSENIESTSGDPFWEKAEMIYLQSLFYYVIRHYEKRHQNFTNILRLIRLSTPNNNGISKLDELFDNWALKEPDAIGVKQYKHFKVAASSPKMMSTIIMTATARLAAFNIKEIANLTDTDNMELERIGMPLDDSSPLLNEINRTTGKHIRNGKVAYFIITKPSDRNIQLSCKYFLHTSICND